MRLPPGTLPIIPCPDEIPEWSDETEQLLGALNSLERAFVEWSACGLSGAEAYRRARGITEYHGRGKDTAKQNAYSLTCRPRVQAALHAAMKDMNFEARMDRAWFLQRLEIAIAKCEASDRPDDQEVLARLIDTAARLKGEIGQAPGASDGAPQRVDVHVRIDAVLEGVAALIGQRKGGVSPAIGRMRQAIDGGGSDDPLGSE